MINAIKKTKVYGWSRSDFTLSHYYKTSSLDEVNSIFELAKKNNKKISLRCGGRSYGDNTLNKNNIILNYFSNNKIIHFDENIGIIETCGSANLIDILKYSIPRGWILHVCQLHSLLQLQVRFLTMFMERIVQIKGILVII